jgi:hypothetical protein
LVLLTRAANPAKPFDEESDLDLLATLANATFLTRAGEVRRSRLVCTEWPSLSTEEDDRDGEGLAFRLPFRRVM